MTMPGKKAATLSFEV